MLHFQPRYNHKIKGFTLLELLTVLSILATIFLWAIPLSQDFLLKNKLSARTEEIVSALHYARSQANLLNQSLTLTPKNNQWNAGLILYDASKKLLFQWQWLDKDLTLSWHGMYGDYLLFGSDESNSVLAGSFYLCAESLGKKITLNRLGRIRVEDNNETCHT